MPETIAGRMLDLERHFREGRASRVTIRVDYGRCSNSPLNSASMLPLCEMQLQDLVTGLTSRAPLAAEHLFAR